MSTEKFIRMVFYVEKGYSIRKAAKKAGFYSEKNLLTPLQKSYLIHLRATFSCSQPAIFLTEPPDQTCTFVDAPKEAMLRPFGGINPDTFYDYLTGKHEDNHYYTSQCVPD